MDFSTPIRRVPDTTAPLTTLITTSTDMASPISPNATMNGTHGANEAVACALAASQDCAPSTLPCGSAAVTAATSAFTAAVVAALEKSYSICDAAGAPAEASAAISPGVTQPCAVPVTDVAMPTTASFGEPATPATVTCDPIPSCRPDWPDNTICPGPVAQWPEVSVRSSTGPPAPERPTRVSDWWMVKDVPFPAWPPVTGMDGVTCALTGTVTSGYGPADAVTPGRWVVAASCAGEAPVTVAVTSAPCCAANARSNGALESISRPRASVEAAVETSTTKPIAMACTRRPDSPPRAARRTGIAFIAVLPSRERRWRSGRRRSR